MAVNSSNNYIPEISFDREVAFEYKNESYKIHVSLSIEEQETFYKLYFKNNFEDTDKSLMKLFRIANLDGTFTWKCKKDYFSYNNDELATVAGQAIDRFLQEEYKNVHQL